MADLTYTQQTIASDIVPAAIGMIAEFVRTHMDDPPEVRLFKFPEDLASALEKERPDVMGVSAYVWNSRLSATFCDRIKAVYPDVVTVMGGPNFPTTEAEQREFLQHHRGIDYFVMKEGEAAFLHLLEHLRENGCRPGTEPAGLANIVYLDGNGDLVPARNVDRMMDLTRIPSPYLSGLLDEFLDGRLLPAIQTNRGCPFSCTFCTEGQSYWSKVRRKDIEIVAGEIQYISSAMTQLPADSRRTDLLIADSNFAMFKEDLDVCRVIAAEQERRGYPKYINVATGKNRKERVIEAAKLVHGAIKLAGSVQSLDPAVQANIKRSNISGDQIVEMALRASEVGTNSYSEVILGLPGDTREAHFKTLETLIESGFNTLSMYQLMVLPGTELGEAVTKSNYGMQCRYRVIPRCFGVYDVLGETVSVAEVEEICVANNTLPYEDYLLCRKMNFIVNVFYNDGVLAELTKLLIVSGVSCWQWMKEIYQESHSEQFDKLTAAFLDETENELWSGRDELEGLTADPGVVRRYIDGDMGNNLIFKYKALSITRYFGAVCEVALGSIRAVLARAAPERPELAALAEEIVAFKRQQIENLFVDTAPRRAAFHFDVPAFVDAPMARDAVDIAGLRLAQPRTLEFKSDAEQRATIDSYVKLFGTDVRGLSRILSRVYLKQLMRQPTVANDQPANV